MKGDEEIDETTGLTMTQQGMLLISCLIAVPYIGLLLESGFLSMLKWLSYAVIILIVFLVRFSINHYRKQS